jgi:hypothetical protein
VSGVVDLLVGRDVGVEGHDDSAPLAEVVECGDRDGFAAAPTPAALDADNHDVVGRIGGREDVLLGAFHDQNQRRSSGILVEPALHGGSDGDYRTRVFREGIFGTFVGG